MEFEFVDFPNWRWTTFVNTTIKGLAPFAIKNYPIPKQFAYKETKYGSDKFCTNIRIKTLAFSGRKINFLRAVCLDAGRLGSVLNLVIQPSYKFDLPFFGADFVSLPNVNLMALDLQPVLKDDSLHTKVVWSKLIPLHNKWQSILPDGGPIPEDAKKFFSPGFLWTKSPANENIEQLINDLIKPAFDEYLELYIKLMDDSIEHSAERSDLLKKGQNDYLEYRAVNDPARGMLTRYFGEEWTESYINRVLFKLL